MLSAEAALHQQTIELLRHTYGEDAVFRDGQWEAIAALVLRRERLLVVQRTGWGKSLVYFLATRLIRAAGDGPTVLISPLLSLMRNQIEAAERQGLRAVVLNSTNYSDHAAIEALIVADRVDLLLISPERLANERFRTEVWTPLAVRIGLLVIDEAHCISDWGHDFRPDYRRILTILDDLTPGTPILGTTATANDRVVTDVTAILGSVNVQRGSLARPSLQLFTYPEPQSAAYRLALLDHLMRALKGSGIIYCTTTNDCLRVARWLEMQGHAVKPYYANVESETGERREALEAALINNEVKALVASVALGMGFDKPDLHFVIHYQYPGSIVGYYQQIGRAGRGIDSAFIILMHGYEDEDIQRYFIDTAFPKESDVEDVVRAIAETGKARQAELLEAVNIRQKAMNKVLQHLEIDGVIMKHKSRYILADRSPRPDYAQWAGVTAQRYRELEQIQTYLRHDGCLMRFIADALDDPENIEPCGRCQNCRGRKPSVVPPRDVVERASLFLRKDEAIEFRPRRLFPRGISDVFKGRIAEPNCPGLALCLYHDQGWGELVRLGKYRDNHYSDELVEASAVLLRERWTAQIDTPRWVCPVPSRRHPLLVPNFARRLADALELPFRDIVRSATVRPAQKTMHNTRQQAANVADSFALDGDVWPAPVLLVDDMMDSGWTLTIIGHLLRLHGSGAVHPFVLAKVNYGDFATD